MGWIGFAAQPVTLPRGCLPPPRCAELEADWNVNVESGPCSSQPWEVHVAGVDGILRPSLVPFWLSGGLGSRWKMHLSVFVVDEGKHFQNGMYFAPHRFYFLIG